MHLPEVESAFISNLRVAAPQLAQLQAEIEAKRLEGYYRFYHYSWKVYRLQQLTEQMVKALQELLPDRTLNKKFTQIIAEGTGKQWEQSHNKEWLRYTLPIVQVSAGGLKPASDGRVKTSQFCSV
jgi:hypothetical protein